MWHGKEEALQGNKGRLTLFTSILLPYLLVLFFASLCWRARLGDSSEPADVSAAGQRCKISLGTAVLSSSICCLVLL